MPSYLNSVAAPVPTFGITPQNSGDASATVQGLASALTRAQELIEAQKLEIETLRRENSQLQTERNAQARSALKNAEDEGLEPACPAPQRLVARGICLPVLTATSSARRSGKAFAIFHEVWVDETVLELPRPEGVDPMSADRFADCSKSSVRYNDGLLVELHDMLPEGLRQLHELYPKDVAVALAFFMSDGRSGAVNDCKGVRSQIFDHIRELDSFSWEIKDIQSSPAIARFLRGVEDQQHINLFPPILYRHENVRDGYSALFGNPALPKIAQVCLHGPLSLGKPPRFIAFCGIVAIFLLSGDLTFTGTGSFSKFNYADRFRRYKSFLSSKWTSTSGIAVRDAFSTVFMKDLRLGSRGELITDPGDDDIEMAAALACDTDKDDDSGGSAATSALSAAAAALNLVDAPVVQPAQSSHSTFVDGAEPVLDVARGTARIAPDMAEALNDMALSFPERPREAQTKRKTKNTSGKGAKAVVAEAQTAEAEEAAAAPPQRRRVTRRAAVKPK
ncbi:hypothetical protein HDZ31DRAFT_62943 [Schizophyllum fasciatum]